MKTCTGVVNTNFMMVISFGRRRVIAGVIGKELYPLFHFLNVKI